MVHVANIHKPNNVSYLYNNLLISPREKESHLYNRLPVLRAERGLSRQDLTTAVEVNSQTIGYLERGDDKPSLELAFRLSEYFGLPIEAIFSRAPFKPLSEEKYPQD
ncbi:helix-turn-helix transcriptional regulator [Deinococcus sp. Arct2-2]|uniref:helix-turn-helix transcriptional regulator n=1 Tax=Deinococcus sp. Arct2-2 TaxID=2568653 RepID=UPI003211EF1B